MNLINIEFLLLDNLLQCHSLILNIASKENNAHYPYSKFFREAKKLSHFPDIRDNNTKIKGNHTRSSKLGKLPTVHKPCFHSGSIFFHLLDLFLVKVLPKIDLSKIMHP